MPIKCPVAPLEFAFLADYYFRQKGMRDRDRDLARHAVHRRVHQAEREPHPVEGRRREGHQGRRRISPSPRSTPAKKTIRTFDGRTVDYDLLCAIPPNLGPAVIDDSGLGDGAGYARHRSAHAQEPQGRAHLPARRQHQRRDVEGGVGRALRGRDRGREPAARDRRQGAARDLRRPCQLLRRDRRPQGDAARFQLRHRAARRVVPAAAMPGRSRCSKRAT